MITTIAGLEIRDLCIYFSECLSLALLIRGAVPRVTGCFGHPLWDVWRSRSQLRTPRDVTTRQGQRSFMTGIVVSACIWGLIVIHGYSNQNRMPLQLPNSGWVLLQYHGGIARGATLCPKYHQLRYEPPDFWFSKIRTLWAFLINLGSQLISASAQSCGVRSAPFRK